jgi:NADH-quinone oxidoreductase subunit N
VNFGDIHAAGAPILMAVGGSVVLLADLASKRSASRKVGTIVGILFCLAAMVCSYTLGGQLRTAFANGVAVEGLVVTMQIVLAAIAAVTMIASSDLLQSFHLPKGEFRALIMLASAGAMVLVQSLDLVNAFVGIEIMSVAFYVLAGYRRSQAASEEAGAKYFLMGAFVSAILLFGIALVYGSVGLAMKANGLDLPQGYSYTNIVSISNAIHQIPGFGTNPLFLLGTVMLIGALMFKAGVAPFHMVAPDVYQGAPAPIVGFLATTSKVASFTILMRFFTVLAGAETGTAIKLIVIGAALLSILVGNAGAANQKSLKRLFGYSSVAHGGYIVLGLLASLGSNSQTAAITAVTFYIIAYAITTLGCFAVVSWLGKDGEDADALDNYRGLAKRNLGAAITLGIFLLSLSGIPLTVGFLTKLSIFMALLSSGGTWVAVVALIGSAIGLYAYLRVISEMFFYDASQTDAPYSDGASKLVAVSAATLVIVMGVFPSQVLLPSFEKSVSSIPVSGDELK